MEETTQRNRKTWRDRGHLVLAALLAAVVTVPVLLSGSAETVQARRYNYPGYPERIARCKASCSGKNGVIRACIARMRKGAVKGCRDGLKADVASCAGDATCKQDARSRFKLCAKTAAGSAAAEIKVISRKGYGLNRCNGCCQRTRGSSGCIGYFSESRFYGSHRYRGRLICEDEAGYTPTPRNPKKGSPSAAFLPDVTGAIRAQLGRLVPSLVDGWSD